MAEYGINKVLRPFMDDVKKLEKVSSDLHTCTFIIKLYRVLYLTHLMVNNALEEQ